MTRIVTRLVGGGMTLAAVAFVLLLQGTVAPVVLEASFCCEECDARESACYSACSSASHDGGSDTQAACNDSCYYELYESVGACFAHCDFDCTPPGGGWSYYCIVYNHGGGSYHLFDCWDTSL